VAVVIMNIRLIVLIKTMALGAQIRIFHRLMVAVDHRYMTGSKERFVVQMGMASINATGQIIRGKSLEAHN
jgi:hypothetical protein